MSTSVETAIEIRPFHVDISEDALDDLRHRINATNWPEKETVADQSQGVPLAVIQELARDWATEYDWRKCEAALKPAAAVRHRDRRARHSLHPRSFATRRRDAADRESRLAWLDHRATEDHRSTDRSDGTRRERSGCLRCRDSVDARLRVLGEADEHRLGA